MLPNDPGPPYSISNPRIEGRSVVADLQVRFGGDAKRFVVRYPNTDDDPKTSEILSTILFNLDAEAEAFRNFVATKKFESLDP